MNFSELAAYCESRRKLSIPAIDEFLLLHAGRRLGLGTEIAKALYPFRHIVSDLGEEWKARTFAQLFAHRIFKRGGLLPKVFTSREFKALPESQQEFLHQCSGKTWRFSFSVIVGNPAPDFFEMEDALSGETFLLYSKSTTAILAERPVLLWFNLIADNGRCFETYGPVTGYSSFDVDDIFFFATEYNYKIEDEDDIIASVAENPAPYLMLYAFSNLPVSVSQGHRMIISYGEQELDSLDTDRLRENFTLAYTPHVYEIRPLVNNEMPHLPAAYYDEKRKILALTAMTDAGYSQLVDSLRKNGVDVFDVADIRVSINMIIAAEKILRKKISVNSYEKMFKKTPKPGERDHTNRLNGLFAELMPILNKGGTPDFDAIAPRHGFHPAEARQLYDQLVGKRDEMLRRQGR